MNLIFAGRGSQGAAIADTGAYLVCDREYSGQSCLIDLTACVESFVLDVNKIRSGYVYLKPSKARPS